MRTHEIESWALNIIDRVNAGQPTEDQRVELKADWPDPYRAARRIAGHANAARGDSFLWIIGVDERAGVTGASLKDLASWYPQVESQFEGLAPEITPVNVPTGGKTVVALLFESERAPFVVRIEKSDRLEVPWRGSTSIRSARRDELLRILSPRQKLPTFQVRGAIVAYSLDSGKENVLWDLRLRLYVVPKDANRVVIPFHRCKGSVSFPNHGIHAPFNEIFLVQFGTFSPAIRNTSSEILIDAAGILELTAKAVSKYESTIPQAPVQVNADLYPAEADQPATISVVVPMTPDVQNRWDTGDLQPATR